MDGERWSRIETIFDAAAALPAAERARYLDRACAGDARLRSEIESLLASRDAAGSFLESPAIEDLSARDLRPDRTLAREDVPESVGPYRLQRKLGEGGMGEVWLALQEVPLRRQVAVKIVKRGLDSKEILARFEVERQALALMDHPNIARVLDAGTSPTGRPFFAMEYVDGIPLTSYCDARGLTTRRRLALFLQVCSGVQHAHQKAVIHRDLKPSNVLVAEREGAAIPKIIDFGVAKALSQSLTDVTLYTGLGQLIGTPAYMSPEQAEMSPAGVDTRTDVYSLGVILYELLVGTTPLDPAELRRAGFDEIRRRIREEEPPRPSTRVPRRSNTGSPRGASQRDTDELSRQLRGDLDWIVLKALEKDRDRRYSSPAELAADLERHLHDLPVLARPPSRIYRASKFVRRHRLGVATTATVLALLVAFALSTAVQTRRVAEQRDRAREAEARATAINDFLVKDMLEAAGPSEAEGRELTVAEVLDAASRKVGDSFAGQPGIEVPLRVAMGGIYKSLGHFDQAEQHYAAAESIARQQLGGDDPRTLSAIRGVAILNDAQGHYDRAEPLYREVLEGQRRTLGPRHPETLETMESLGLMLCRSFRSKDGEDLGREALQGFREVLGDEHPRTVNALIDYACALEQANSPNAEPFLREACERCRAVLGPRDPMNVVAMNSLAICLNRQKRIEEAEATYRQCVLLSSQVYGESNPQTLGVRTNLARFVKERAERPWEAEKLYRGILAEWAHSADERAIWTATQLGEVLIALGRAEEARTLFSTTLRDARAGLGPEHDRTTSVLSGLGWANRVQGRLREAEDCYRQVFEIRRKVLGPDHDLTLRASAQIGWTMVLQGRLAEGERLVHDAVERGRVVLPAKHQQMHVLLEILARVLLVAGRAPEAEACARESLEINSAGPALRIATAEKEALLAECLLRQGKLTEAAELLTRAWPVMARNRGAAFPLRMDARRDVLEVYRRIGTPQRADSLLAAPTLEQLAGQT